MRSDFWVMKGIWISAIVVAFVAGTIVTGASVFASDFLFPPTYIKTASDPAIPDTNADVTLACDEGDTFVSGSAHGPPRPDATPLNILINEPQVNAGGSIEWHATARNPDQFGSLDLTVNIICVDSNNDEVHDDETTDETSDETSDG